MWGCAGGLWLAQGALGLVGQGGLRADHWLYYFAVCFGAMALGAAWSRS
jgi:hypothetical protein